MKEQVEVLCIKISCARDWWTGRFGGLPIGGRLGSREDEVTVGLGGVCLCAYLWVAGMVQCGCRPGAGGFTGKQPHQFWDIEGSDYGQPV